MVTIVRRGFVPLGIVGILLIAGAMSSPKGIAPSWNFKVENMTSFAMSRNGEYIIAACEKGPLCEKGQFYVFDRYGNAAEYGCIESEITVVDIADDGAFFIGTRNGYYFSPGSGRIQEDLNMGSVFESVSISENSEIVIVGTNEEILIFDRNSIKDKKNVGRSVNLTAISASGNIAVAGTKDTIFLYEKSTETWMELLANGTITALAVSEDGSTVICGMTTGIIWILDSHLNIQKTSMVEGGVMSTAMTMDGAYFVCGTRKNKIFYLDSSGNEIWSVEMKEDIQVVTISIDGNLVAVLSGNITLLDSSGKRLQEVKSSEIIQNMYVSKLGEILSYSSNNELVFLELYQQSLVYTYEYMLPSRRSIPLDDQLTEVWSYGETPYSVIVADVSGDGCNEIICSFTKEIVVINSEGKVLWKKSFTFQPGLTVMDLTGDLVPEIIVMSTDNRLGFQIFSGKGQELMSHEFYSRWFSVPPPREIGVVMWANWSGDIDNDGFIEVVCLVSAGYYLEPRGLYAFEYPSFKEEWYYPTASTPERINFSDINGDGQIEIIAGSNAPCNGRRVGRTDDCHAYIYAVTLQGEELWTKQIGPAGYKRIHIVAVDLDNDGKKEIIGGGWSFEDNWGVLFALDSDGNYILGEGNEFDHSVFLDGAADLNNDGNVEILISSSPSILILYDHKLREVKRQNVPITLGNLGEAIINDIDADGEKEIIFSSIDKKLLILNADLEEEWSKTFPSYRDYLKKVVVNLYGCKNYLLVLADKLYAYTYSYNPGWPCIPWVIVEQQKIVEAQSYIEKGNKCLVEENCECAKTEFTLARDTYSQIQDKEGIAQAEEKINTAENCSDFKNSFEEAKKLFEEADQALIRIYISKRDEYLSEAENYLFNIENNLAKAEEAYGKVWEGESEEIEEYYRKFEEIRNAVNYFDTGRRQIKEGKIEKAEENLQRLGVLGEVRRKNSQSQSQSKNLQRQKKNKFVKSIQ